MILPIVAYGHPVLRKKAIEIPKDYPGLDQLIKDMWETMYHAQGVGLAAPQIGRDIRLFVMDASPFADDEPELDGFKQVFINPTIIEQSGKNWSFNEGCLSIPGIREDVSRRESLVIQYYDEDFELYEEELSGLAARIIQHEYDHIEGKLFTDLLPPFKRALLKGKLSNIAKGEVDVNYKMKFVK